ncbi:phytanoyl-CoA dioxygenase family protein [Nonomuraea sp. NEAU-A123]|uniref:phytanoyl-CoA dioxygenase family protein n=1 Tax=Nonomuraea sp. NEAU-A123 TaxID=2839649 RepID=UPI001BE4D32A|nr:phytanoyl-CoA dioxygenase family protein [Nonomuraea sp. NEAU-A123]MBT2234736.1 phytanoyl-CoA dioxygenase family protein [Nonomuraea sp. NEAU-A123]
MTINFVIHNADVVLRERTCTTMLTPQEENVFVDQGVVVPANRMPDDTIDLLRDAIDLQVAEHFPSAEDRTYDAEFSGQYVRDPHKQDPQIAMIPLLSFGLADTVRCLLGPRIVLRNSNVRVTHPRTGDGTVWHTDYRPHTSPASRLASAPTVITCLIYLDAADEQTGPLLVVPGSHNRLDQPPATDDPLDDQVMIQVQPGQVVLMNAAMWHRGGANHSERTTRRLLTLQLSSIFMPEFNFEPSLPSAAYQRLLEQARSSEDEPLLELLGHGGLNPTSARY